MIDLLARTSLILAVAWFACRLLTRATPATRHLVWHLAIVAILAAPILLPFVPRFPLPQVPGVPKVLLLQTMKPPLDAASTPGTPGTPGTFGTFGTFGTLGTLGWFALGRLTATRQMRRSRRAPELEALAHSLSRRRVAVCIANGEHGPLVSGIVSSSILLPASAVTWDAGRLRAVLLHELAHVRRRDCRAQLLAQIACSVYWFNPLVWIAARALRSECERACDDEVLAHGTAASTYAADLLELVSVRQRRIASGVVAMARRSDLERRLLSILAAGRVRVPARSTRWAVVGALALTTVITLGATAAPAPRIAARPAPATADSRERATLKLALDSSGDAVPALIDALRDSDSQVREKAALGLGWRGDDRTIVPLIAALGDDDAQVREKAALSLGSSGDARAVAPLEAALRDPDSQVREKAATGLILLRAGRNHAIDGQVVRSALGGLVNGLLALVE